MNNTSPAASALGGGAGARRGAARGGGRSRRAKNRRYRLNRKARSRLTIVSWNAEDLRTKKQELERWLSVVKADVVAIQEAQLAANKTPSLSGYQTAAVTRRARGRRSGGPAKGGDVALFVRDRIQFSTIDRSPLHPQDDSTEWCAIWIFLQSSQPSSQPNLPSTNPSYDIFNVCRTPIRPGDADERIDHFSLDSLQICHLWR